MSTKHQPIEPLSAMSATYMAYPPGNGIRNSDRELQDTNPEYISTTKVSTELNDSPSKIDFSANVDGNDRGMPVAEPGDTDDTIGDEDDEDNYYSMGSNNLTELEDDHYD